MMRSSLREVGRLAPLCATSWLAASGLACADAGVPGADAGSGLGLGGAYLFGLIAGFAMFGIRYALEVRKSHLAAFGKK